MVQGRQILMLCSAYIASISGYKILRFWTNPQKYTQKNGHPKVIFLYTCHHLSLSVVFLTEYM